MTFILRRRKLGRTSCKEIVAKSKTGIRLFRNDAVLPKDPEELCIRWGCTSNVASRRVLNKVEAIHAVANKTGFRRTLNEKGLCPATYFSRDELTDDVFPIIIRPQTHHQGRHLYFCKTPAEAFKAINECGAGWYAGKFIDKVAEYRVFVVSGRAVAVAKKTPADPKAIAWNVAQGGKFDNVRWDDWPLKAVRIAIEGFMLSGLDFGGVDIMVDGDGNAFILEINSAPSLTSPYRQEVMAKTFDYINEKGKDFIPLIEARGGYRKFIHPAVCPDALMP